MLLADRGYDADWIRTLVNEQGAWANVPPRCNRREPICFSPDLYRARNLVERFVKEQSGSYAPASLEVHVIEFRLEKSPYDGLQDDG